jgi:hypothetical protein
MEKVGQPSCAIPAGSKLPEAPLSREDLLPASVFVLLGVGVWRVWAGDGEAIRRTLLSYPLEGRRLQELQTPILRQTPH